MVDVNAPRTPTKCQTSGATTANFACLAGCPVSPPPSPTEKRPIGQDLESFVPEWSSQTAAADARSGYAFRLYPALPTTVAGAVVL